MKIAIVGTGYVGLVSAACFADVGVDVSCIDIDEAKIERLKRGEIPIYEPQLKEIIERCVAQGRLHFTTSLAEVINDVAITFIAVGTPPDEDGSADISQVLKVARQIGESLTQYNLIVTKSTVPVGSSQLIKQEIQSAFVERGLKLNFDVASNPEFLKEGKAVEDCMHPERVIIGVESPRAKALLEELYQMMGFRSEQVFFMDIQSSEMTKYAANAMLATRISFMNEIALLCEKVGANVDDVRAGIGSDSRIGKKFLNAGCGYGGSCFPKDIKALIKTGLAHEQEMKILTAVEEVNSYQKTVLFHKFQDYYLGSVAGKKVAVWGLAFKPETDDVRESCSMTLIAQLLEADCQVVVYDPIAIEPTRAIFGDRLIYADDVYASVEGVEAVFHITEWQEFRQLDWQKVRCKMKYPLFLDGRNIFTNLFEEGFTYLRIG